MMRFGICAPYREVAAWETYPFDYLEESVQRFLLPERPQEDFEEVWQQARRLPIPIEAANSLLPADLLLVATPTQSVDEKRLERYMKTPSNVLNKLASASSSLEAAVHELAHQTIIVTRLYNKSEHIFLSGANGQRSITYRLSLSPYVTRKPIL